MTDWTLVQENAVDTFLVMSDEMETTELCLPALICNYQLRHTHLWRLLTYVAQPRQSSGNQNGKRNLCLIR